MLPDALRSNATRLRWVQPAGNGSRAAAGDDWALDHVYVGGSVGGRPALQDPAPEGATDVTWVQRPGSVLEPVCGSAVNALHFGGACNSAFAMILFTVC